MLVIASSEMYYIVLQFHYMSLHRGGFADGGGSGSGFPTVTVRRWHRDPAGTAARSDSEWQSLAAGPGLRVSLRLRVSPSR